MLDIAYEAETKPVTKWPYRWPHKHSIEKLKNEDEFNVLEKSLKASDIESAVYVVLTM